VLDGTGKILLADAAARALWRAGGSELIGEHFSALFAFEVTSKDSRWLEAQWDVLLSAAVTAPLRLVAQPKDGPRLGVSVRLEAATAASGPVCFAFVQVDAAPGGTGADPLALLAERSPVGVFDLNFKAGTFYYSPAWAKQLGYAEQELSPTFETWRSLLHAEDSTAAPDRVGTKFFNGLRSFSVEYRLRHKKGHYVWLHGIGLQVFGPEGDLERVAGVHVDITERKEFEDTVIESEQRFEELTHHGPLGAFDLNFAAGRHWFSPAWKRLLGYAADDLIDGPDTLTNVLHPDDAAAGLKEFFLARHPGQAAYLDLCRLRHKDGHYVWVLSGVFRQVSRKRELLRVLGFHCALPAELPVAGGPAIPPEFLSGAFAELQEGLVLVDVSGRVTLANDKAARLLGETSEALPGRLLGEIFPLVRRVGGQPAEFPMDRLLEAGEPVALTDDYSLARAEGAEPQPISFSARPVQDSAAKTVGAAIVFRNPQEMTLTPEELVRANRFESLGALAGGIAHDFNNLLTTILGGISLAKDNRDSSGLADSENACLAAKGLTKQLLTSARGGTAVRIVLAPQGVLKDAVRVATAGASTEVAVEVAPATGNILADRAQIRQVFQNLIVNAVQAMPEGRPGHVWLRAANIALAEGQVPPLAAGNYVQFEVQDDGAGIPPENLQKIFDAFFTTKKHGTGLGLATVLEVVRKHGGQIGVDSTVGTGTTFTIFLPQAEQPAEIEARRAPTLRFGTGRVLFMDDDEKICALTAGMLTGLEYKYDIAKHGEEAITLYKRYLNIGRPYDAVIMDLTIIGGMGGEMAFRKLRELDPDVRAIISSGYDSEEMAQQYLDMGFCGYLTKPYRVADLGRILKTVLG
jgi:PAS domain S-box-containing protein